MDVTQVRTEGVNTPRRSTNRLSGINQRLFNTQRQFQLSWQAPKEQQRINNLQGETITNRLIINNAVLAMDLVIELIRQEINELRPKIPRIDFKEILQYTRQNLPQIVIDKFNRLLGWLFSNNRPRVLQGRDALLETELLPFKRPCFDDTDTDDAISLGESTLAASDRMRTAELEQELAKIKENMSSVFESKIAEMQSTINKQAEAQAEMQAKMNEMIEQFKAVNIMTPATKSTSVPIVSKCPPPAPPLPPSMQTPKFGKDRTNLTDSTRPNTDVVSLKLKSVDECADPKSTSENHLTNLKTSKESAPTPKQPLGYDYRNELAIQLQKRRQAIEKKDNYEYVEREKKNCVNPIVSSMLERIPVQTSSPGSPRRRSVANASCCTDEDEWN